MKFHKYIAVGTACAVLGGGGIATAATTGLINGHNIKRGSIPTNRLNPQAQRAIERALHLKTGLNGVRGLTGFTGTAGATGTTKKDIRGPTVERLIDRPPGPGTSKAS